MINCLNGVEVIWEKIKLELCINADKIAKSETPMSEGYMVADDGQYGKIILYYKLLFTCTPMSNYEKTPKINIL